VQRLDRHPAAHAPDETARILRRRRRQRVRCNVWIAIPQRMRQTMGDRRVSGCQGAYAVSRFVVSCGKHLGLTRDVERVHDCQKAVAIRPQRLRQSFAHLLLITDTLHHRQHVERMAYGNGDRRRRGKRLFGREARACLSARRRWSAAQRKRRPAARRGAHSFPSNSSPPARAPVRGNV